MHAITPVCKRCILSAVASTSSKGGGGGGGGTGNLPEIPHEQLSGMLRTYYSNLYDDQHFDLWF
jgi:hypothetical protein